MVVLSNSDRCGLVSSNSASGFSRFGKRHVKIECVAHGNSRSKGEKFFSFLQQQTQEIAQPNSYQGKTGCYSYIFREISSNVYQRKP